jgi:hypothetical protein
MGVVARAAPVFDTNAKDNPTTDRASTPDTIHATPAEWKKPLVPVRVCEGGTGGGP